MNDDKTILHIDINNFYASVAILLNKELQGKAVVVCGDAEKRHGIVLAKSDLAKKAGIKTGETIWKAKQKIKDLIIVPPDFHKYNEYSRKVFNIYTNYTPLVESFGLDECWLDVTGCKKLFGSGEEIAYLIKERIKKEIGLTVSVGVSFSKVFAKLGSDMKKPDAVTILSRYNYKSKIWPQKIDEMIFVGKPTEIKLNKYGIYTIGELANANKCDLIKIFGKVGEKLYDYANGFNDDKVKLYTEYHIPESVGNGTTTLEDITNIYDATSVVYSLSEVIAYRLRRYGLTATNVSISIRNSDLKSIIRQSMLNYASDSAADISQKAIELIQKNYDFTENLPLRTITVSVGNFLSGKNYDQMNLFENDINKNRKLEDSVDKLRLKYGFGILKRGITMGTIFTCDSKEIEDDFIPFDKRSKSEE